MKFMRVASVVACALSLAASKLVVYGPQELIDEFSGKGI